MNKIILAIIVISFGILETVLVSGTVQELIDENVLNDKASSDDTTYQELTGKIGYMTMNLIFAVLSLTYGLKTIKRVISKSKSEKSTSSRADRINNREKKLAYFHTQFGFGTLVIAVLISFSIQSMDDDRDVWMYVWGILSIVGIIYLVRYRKRKLDEIFDDDYYR